MPTKRSMLCKDGYVVFTQDETHVSLIRRQITDGTASMYATMHLSYAKKSVTVMSSERMATIKIVDASNGETFIVSEGAALHVRS